MGSYPEYRGGGVILNTVGDIMMQVGDIMSTVGGVQYQGGIFNIVTPMDPSDTIWRVMHQLNNYHHNSKSIAGH